MQNPENNQKAILTTNRLHLRELEDDDLDFVATMLSDSGVMQFYPKPLGRDEAAAWLERQQARYQRDGHGLWLVEDIQTNEPIGQVGVIRQEVEGESLIEVGYLIHQPFWKKGYAIEAATACKQYAFNQLDAKTVHSLIRPANIPSQRVALRNGMKPMQFVLFKDLDHLMFGVSH